MSSTLSLLNKRISASLLFVLIVLLEKLQDVSASRISPPATSTPSLNILEYEEKYLRYAAFGDSWASGVNYGPPDPVIEYDFAVFEEVCRCRRVNEAYAVQLRDDSNRNWTNGRVPDLDFQACHGAFFDAIPDQVARLNQTFAPRLATLMIGGNNGGFPDLIENCIYQPNNGKDYGPGYPDANGECAKALQRANDNVRASWFKDGIRNSINTILDEPRIRKDPHFRLYVLGYASLFNHDDPACNNQTFGVIPGKQQHLSTKLRKDINLVIDAGRKLYDQYINHELRNPNVRFLDINPAFAGHRFCEPTENGSQDAQIQKSWLWSLTWPSCLPLSSTETDTSSSHSYLRSQELLTVWPGFCRKCGDLSQLGEVQRPFHPKPDGHKAIKDMLMQVLLEDAQKSGASPAALAQMNPFFYRCPSIDHNMLQRLNDSNHHHPDHYALQSAGADGLSMPLDCIRKSVHGQLKDSVEGLASSSKQRSVRPGDITSH